MLVGHILALARVPGEVVQLRGLAKRLRLIRDSGVVIPASSSWG
jgi:hypothetical protein